MLLDRDSLEMLIMDKDAGALSAEASQLLELYLGQNAAAARQANDLRQTMYLARRVYAANPKPVLPKPAFGMPSVAETRHPSRFGLPAWAAMAACLALGFLTGTFWMHQPVTMRQAMSEPVASSASSAAQPVGPAQISAPFWSVKNWQLRANEKPRHGGYSVEWESPLKKPGIKINS
jgi:hypothetical protein